MVSHSRASGCRVFLVFVLDGLPNSHGSPWPWKDFAWRSASVDPGCWLDRHSVQAMNKMKSPELLPKPRSACCRGRWIGLTLSRVPAKQRE